MKRNIELVYKSTAFIDDVTFFNIRDGFLSIRIAAYQLSFRIINRIV